MEKLSSVGLRREQISAGKKNLHSLLVLALVDFEQAQTPQRHKADTVHASTIVSIFKGFRDFLVPQVKISKDKISKVKISK